MRNVFCDTGWNQFECTGEPESSGAKAHTSEVFSGGIHVLSTPNLLDDSSIKQGLESETITDWSGDGRVGSV